MYTYVFTAILAGALAMAPASAAEPVKSKLSPTATTLTPAPVVSKEPAAAKPSDEPSPHVGRGVQDRIEDRKEAISDRKELGDDRREVRAARDTVKEAIDSGDQDAVKAAADELRDAKDARRESRSTLSSDRHDIRTDRRGPEGIRGDRRQRRR